MANLPSSLLVTGTIVDSAGSPQASFKLRGKLLSVDGTVVAPVLDGPMKPTEVTTGADGGFSFTIKDTDAIKQLLTQGAALLFKSAADDNTDTADVGLSRTTPLHLSAYVQTRVVLEWQPKQAGDATHPALSAQLRVARVLRDDNPVAQTLKVCGQVMGPQQKPLAGLSIQLSLVVPATGQTLAFPLGKPVATTDENGAFRFEIERGGDLLPFHPYLSYGLAFRAAKNPAQLRTGAAAASSTCHVRADEPTDFGLVYDDSGATPTLAVAKALRNGHECGPSEGTVESVGLLTDASNRPLAFHRVQVRAGTPLRSIGDVTSNAAGYVRLPHPWPLGKAPQDLTLSYQLRVLDPLGKELAAAVPLSRDGVSESALAIKITPAAETDTSPTIDALLTELKAKLGAKTKAAIAKEGLKSLFDVLKSGGVRGVKDIDKTDDTVLAQLEQGADLWSLLPPSVSAAEAVKSIAVWLGKGIAGTAHIGSLPRSEATKLLAPELGDFRAAQLHHVAVVRNNFLNQVLINARKRQSSRLGMGLRGAPVAPLMSFSLESGCGCAECQTAVSPNAYLADLIRYVYARIRLDTGSGPNPVTVEDLDTLFFQPFSQLPETCAAMKDSILLVRIAVEVLRAYAAANPLSDPGDISDLAAAEAAYRAQAYAALLSELGTNTTELRLALGDDDRLTEMAGVLGLPSKTEVEALLLTDMQLANEDLLESRFGLRKSTRLPLTDPSSPAEVITWKRNRLYAAWRTQDKPVTFPSGVPILDPDVVHSSNLRLYWNSSHDTTTVWNARRTAINTQLTSITSARAVAVGAGVITVSQPTLMRAATTDESWAAYLVMNLSDDEVQSMAATLSLADQPLARQKAAEQKVKLARAARSGMAVSTLTTDEQATVDAILTYVGTALNPKAQLESDNWVKARFEGLTPTSGSALNEAGWTSVYGVLKGVQDSPTLETVTADLARFNFAQDAFLRAWDLRNKLKGQGFRAMSAGDWAEFDAIFVARWKVGQVSGWISEEGTKNIKVTSELFWKSPDQPAQPRWLGNSDIYNAFLRTLESALSEPIVDPTLITTGAIRDIDPMTSAVMTRYSDRQDWIDTTQAALVTRKGTVSAAMAGSKLAEFDDKLLAYALLIPNADTMAKPWYEPGSLQKSFDLGTMPIERLDQLLLLRPEFDQIFRVRNLIKGNKTVSNQDWDAALKGLFLAMLRRKYGTWRAEEATSNIALSPEFFVLPPVPALTFPPAPAIDDEPATSYRTKAELITWRAVLSARTTQDTAIDTAQAELIDRVEQATLPGLRDALMALYSPDEPLDWWTDRMLMDFAAAANTKVSRVSHAITTLQQLFFGLRSGEVFQLKNATNAALYPVLTIDGDHFDEEWRWMGSYGSWRSALFIFMYPENLLYPTLRPDAERSAPFNALVQQARDGGPLTPARAQRLADEYAQYFQDLCKLVTVSVCTVPLFSADGTEKPTLLFFATANGRLYYGRQEVSTNTSSPVGRQQLWQPIRSFSHVDQVHGSVPYTTPNGEQLVCLIVTAHTEKDASKLQTLRLKLALIGSEQWEDGPHDLGDLPKSPLVDPYVTIAVEKSPPTLFDSPPHIYVGVQGTRSYITSGTTHVVNSLSVYRRPLTSEATGWDGKEWDAYRLGYIDNFAHVLMGFTLSTPDENRNGQRRFAFIAREEVSSYSYVYCWKADPVTGLLAPECYLTGIRGLVLLNDSISPFVDAWSAVVLCHPNSLILWRGYAEGLSWTGLNNPYSLESVHLPWHAAYLFEFSFELLPRIVAVSLGDDPEDRDQIGGVAIGYNTPYRNVTVYGNGPINLRLSTDEALFKPLTSTQSTTARAETLALLYSDVYYRDFSWLHFYEAFFAVPMHLASQLQQGRYYQEALDWYRLVYDYTLHGVSGSSPDPRKIYTALSDEEDAYSIYGSERSAEWLADPFNPHAIASQRASTYTRFTMQVLVGCLLDYADSEFAADTAETLPRARTLYLAALRLLDDPTLQSPTECADVVAEIDFSFVPGYWGPQLSLMMSSLQGALGSLPESTGKSLINSILTTLKDTTIKKWSERFAKAKKAIRTALDAQPKPPKLSEIAKKDRELRAQTQLALLGLESVRRRDAALRRQAGASSRRRLATLVGVDETTLDTTPTLKLDWLKKPFASKGQALTADRRHPVLVQPESVIKSGYKQKYRWDPTKLAGAAAKAQKLATTPDVMLAESEPMVSSLMVTTPLLFCVPINPILQSLRLRAQLNLYKLRSGRDITGVERTVDFYAAPTDAQTGLPSLSGNGGLALANTTGFRPTELRYPALIERARRQAQLAAQFESQLLQALEKVDIEARNLLEARNNLRVQRSLLSLKNLEVKEADLNVQLVDVQIQRNEAVLDYLDRLIAEDVNVWEILSLVMLHTSVGFTIAAAGFNFTAAALNVSAATVGALNFAGSLSSTAAAAGSFAAAFSSLASVHSTYAQIASQQASFERRRKEWQQNQTLARFDAQALSTQRKIADVRVSMKEQEVRIAEINIDNAESVVDFLASKFTNKELYEWMSRVMQGLYSAQLQQATATARLAQQQLSFDLLQEINTIRADYWTMPVEGSLNPNATDKEPDRRGLTGSARLLRDIEDLDGLVVSQAQRRLQLTRTISLASMAPGELQRLKETGELWFETKEVDFDREFPGHYFRRIHRVRVSVLALTPPVRGIRATLRNVGASRVVVPTLTGFSTQTLAPSHDEISLSAPQNASGLFELDAQPELRPPFEGIGVDTQWHFELPKPSNFMDYDSIADILITFEYTALNSNDYRAELVQSPAKLPTTFSAVRVFSFRNELVDQWYALHNAPLAPGELRVQFRISPQDFPSGVSRIRVRRITFYMPMNEDARGQKADLSTDVNSKLIGLGFGDASGPAKQALDKDHIIRSESAADAWFRQLPANLSPFGTYTVVLPGTQAVLDLLRADLIRDILIAFTYEADLPAWPTGLKPKTQLF